MSVGINTDLLTLRARVLSETDKENDGGVGTTQLNDWLIEAVRELWARMIPIGRDAFTVSMVMPGTGVVVTAPNLYTLSPADVPPVYAILGVRGVDVDTGGGNYRRIRPWRFGARSAIGRLSYRVRAPVTGNETAGPPSVKGYLTIEILPKEMASSFTYRVWYYQAPHFDTPALDLSPISLPFSGDSYVVQKAAARVRVRFEEDPAPHFTLAEQAWMVVRDFLTGGMQGEAGVPYDWTDDDSEGFW